MDGWTDGWAETVVSPLTFSPPRGPGGGKEDVKVQALEGTLVLEEEGPRNGQDMENRLD